MCVFLHTFLPSAPTATKPTEREKRIKKRMKLIKLVREKGRKFSNTCTEKELMNDMQSKKLG